MTDRAGKLFKLVVGDVFHAGPPSLICLIEAIADGKISARTITHQVKLVFDQSTGDEITGFFGQAVSIDSISPLPPYTLIAILSLDRKMRLELDVSKHKLDEDEKKALYFVADYYPLNQI